MVIIFPLMVRKRPICEICRKDSEGSLPLHHIEDRLDIDKYSDHIQVMLEVIQESSFTVDV